jgi:YYY domain-containing protein
MDEIKSIARKPEKRVDWQRVITYLLLIIVLAGGAYLRFIGINWDANCHLHPDERFLSMVQAVITPAEPGTYFDTATSTLNPGNNGYDFFVYGTFPLFIIRYMGEWTGQTGYDLITILGRQLSAIADLVTVSLVYLIGARLYKPKVGLLAAAFYAFAVLPIQLSHFMTVDTFTNTFGMLTVYAGVLIATSTHKAEESFEPEQGENASPRKASFSEFFKGIWPYIFFGIALGMAAASKINAVTLALLLPLIEVIRYSKIPRSQKKGILWNIIAKIAVAAIVSIVVFRICQPYAFKGPGFFNFGINEEWWSAMRSLQAQNAGEVDFPPALQWARRPLTFSLTNMVQWGMGLPLGITAILAFLAMGWQIFKHKALVHLPLWTWTFLYFTWQATAWVRSMRYQMLVYPLFGLFAAWGLTSLWDRRREIKIWFVRVSPRVIRWVGVVLTVVVVIGTVVWAFAFTRIYTRDHSRIAASEWIYENISGPVNLVMETSESELMLQLPYRSGDTLQGNQLYRIPFEAQFDSLVTGIQLPIVTDQLGGTTQQNLRVAIIEMDTLVELATASQSQLPDLPETKWEGGAVTFTFPEAAQLQKGRRYFLELLLEGEDGEVWLKGVPDLNLMRLDGTTDIQSLPTFTQTISSEHAYVMEVGVTKAGVIKAVSIPRMLDFNMSLGMKTVHVTLTAAGTQGPIIATASLTDSFNAFGDGRGEAYVFELDNPLTLDAPQSLNISIELIDGEGALGIASIAPVHESSWDDALPVSMEGFYPYSDGGGIFRGDLNLELYWPDDDSKRTRFETTLDQGDYIFISSNRQWGTTTRVSERYPLTSTYYRNLLGCPNEKDLVWCYNVAEPGDFSGTLGFELVATFDSYPNLGTLEFNDQFAEEAFSVYDHPKVLIFQKTDAYDPQTVRDILRSVNLTKVINMTARQASDYSSEDADSPQTNLMLSEEQLETQQDNGTWSELFDRESPINTSPTLAVIAMYFFTWLLGLIIYPLLRLALPGLADKGYPFIRIAGLMMLAYLVWLAGSCGIPFTRTTILAVLGLLLLVGTVLAVLQRKALREDLRQHWRYYLVVEAIALVSFLCFLFIRMGNPDLWHPWKGGEKPMDFSYLNAVIKSTTFPPYDPWFAGGYINYYYYGFVLVGVPIKLLGIMPATAYNIVLPLLYSMLCLGAFSVGYNFYNFVAASNASQSKPDKIWRRAIWSGIATVLLLAVLGNLGTVQLLIKTFTTMGAGDMSLEGATLLQRLSWLVQGFSLFLQKTPLPLYPGDLYWIPSRTIPGEAITEFPFFTYLYADLHAHLIALPMALLSVAWGMSMLFSKCCWANMRGKLKVLSFIFSMLLGGMVIGALKPTNTWDYYTYLALSIVILVYSGWRNFKPNSKWRIKPSWQRITAILLPILLLAALSYLLYWPFNHWYGLGYSQFGYWTGSKTPLGSYLIHWGLFLFLITSWFAWETHEWMASTPMSALRKLKKVKPWLILIASIVLIVFFALLITKVVVALVVVPLGLWTIILLARPGQSDAKRLVLFLIGTALMLTLAVELFYLVGDIGRMNMVFKLYNQAWVLFALSAGVCTIWTIEGLIHWRMRTRTIWQLGLILLVFSAAMFPLLATKDKINDRMDPDAAQGLDGMAYMRTATYSDMGSTMDLSEDYYAIQWMQDNIVGSPVILEGQAYEYRWGNRYTIYTGLPGVVGWNYHQRQQRAILRSNVVQERVDAVGQFYLTEDQGFVEQFLEQYDVSYIVLGQLEQVFFPGVGLDKFEALDGVLWDEVFHYGSTAIYEVRQ